MQSNNNNSFNHFNNETIQNDPGTTTAIIFQIIGMLTLFYYCIYCPLEYIIRYACNNIGALKRSNKILSPGPGDYAIITGASDGIGKEYARQLAARGYNLLLLSRTEEKLNKLRQEILLEQQQKQTNKNGSCHNNIKVYKSKKPDLKILDFFTLFNLFLLFI